MRTTSDCLSAFSRDDVLAAVVVSKADLWRAQGVVLAGLSEQVLGVSTRILVSSAVVEAAQRSDGCRETRRMPAARPGGEVEPAGSWDLSGARPG